MLRSRTWPSELTVVGQLACSAVTARPSHSRRSPGARHAELPCASHGLGKSTLVAALRALEEAGVVVRGGRVSELVAPRRALVESILDLDPETSAATAAPRPGDRVALDESGEALASDPDPHALARRIRESDLAVHGIARKPEHVWQLEGLHGG